MVVRIYCIGKQIRGSGGALLFVIGSRIAFLWFGMLKKKG